MLRSYPHYKTIILNIMTGLLLVESLYMYEFASISIIIYSIGSQPSQAKS